MTVNDLLSGCSEPASYQRSLSFLLLWDLDENLFRTTKTSKYLKAERAGGFPNGSNQSGKQITRVIPCQTLKVALTFASRVTFKAQ